MLFGLLAILLTLLGAMALFLWWQNPAPEPSRQILAAQGVAATSAMTAKTAYEVAKPVALDWANDAALLSLRSTWKPEEAYQNGTGDWTLVFYSSEQNATALISVVDGYPVLINVREVGSPPILQDETNWLVDSPAVIDHLLSQGGNEFLRSQPGSSLVLTLNLDKQGGWKGTLIHKESRRTFSVHLGPGGDEIVAVQGSD